MDILDRARMRAAPKLNITRLILDLSRGIVHGEDSEAIDEYARQAGIEHPDPQRPFIPFTELRDISKAGSGGYMVAAETQAAIDILRPFSVMAQAGILIEAGLTGDVVIPRTLTKSTPQWLSTETSQITPSTPTLGQIAATPKQIGIVVNFSRQLAKQANAEGFVRRELMRTVGTGVNQAIINGQGAAQPTGILQTAGISTETGTSLAQANVVSMKRKVADANANNDDIAFISTPAIRELVEKRERASGSGFIWDNDRVASRPAYATTDMPAATMICAAWPLVWLGIWGSGFVVEINPYDSFKSVQIQARILVSLDVCVLHPAAVCVSTSIT